MMDLHHSGLPEETELVRIETKDFTLTIKGKPYHQRYESLKSYINLDNKNPMEFLVVGDNIETVEVFNIEEKCLSKSLNVKPIFFENSTYQFVLVPKNDKSFTFYHEYPAIRNSVNDIEIQGKKMLMGNLNFKNEIGLTTFEILEGHKKLLVVTFEVFPVKLDYRKDYFQMIEEVNEEIYNLAYHFIRRTYLRASIKNETNPSKSEFYRLLLEHYNHLIKSVRRIEKQPHHELKKDYVIARADQLSRQDAYTRNYLRKKPEVFIRHQKKGIKIGNEYFLPKKGLKINKQITYNTVENQYIKWVLHRLNYKLKDLIDTIENHFHNSQSISENQFIINQLKNMQEEITDIQFNAFWKSIDPIKQDTTSLVLLISPGYREVYQTYLILSRGLTLHGQIYKISMKDVAQLYEYWTFIKIGEILKRKYIQVSQNVLKVKRDGLFVNINTGTGAKQVFQHPITKEKITLIYQDYYNNLPTISQKPDTVLKIEKKGKSGTFNYIFDAKYRIDYAVDGSTYQRKYGYPGPLEEDINTMHRYRDAIVASSGKRFERLSFGAYVLFPWSDGKMYREHEFYKSIDKVNIGGLPFLPNETELVEQFIERLIEKSPEEIYEEGILPKGTIDHWKSDLEDNVLIGLVSTKEQYKNCIRNKYFVLDKISRKSNTKNLKYLALYLKKDISDENGVCFYGNINTIELYNGKLYFFVDSWKRLPRTIKPKGYGISSYALTTYQLLKEAKELPELFMKSELELTIWKMLRRISEEIKLDLNNRAIDKATAVSRFYIQNIIFELKEKHLVINCLGKIKKVSLKKLESKPSYIFREIVQFISGKI